MQPDLRTKEGALDFVSYKAPDATAQEKHAEVNDTFRDAVACLWDVLPDGPGKTRFIVAVNQARMAANSCIANEGA